jgi:N-acetyl-anhydromuramyl-L-alanine amidase AmpD
MKHGEQGKHVKALQEKLIALGYPLPRWGADGVFGDETLRAAFECNADLWPGIYVEEYHMDVDSRFVQDCVIQAILDAPLPGRPSWLIDTTGAHPIRNAYKTPRKLSDITAIVLHQTACHLGERVKRWHSVPAHIGVTPKGKVILINKLETVCWHANYFNRFSVGIEVDGNFRGVEDRPGTLWKGGGRRSKLTDEQEIWARAAVVWICDEVARHGGKVTDILAHRQTSENRRGDPGEAIWKRIGLWAQEDSELTLRKLCRNDPNYTKGSGLPIPREWDERSEHAY